MGLLKWFGLGRSEKDESTPKERINGDDAKAVDDTPKIVVYGTSDATRCASLRELLKKNNYEFKDVRVDGDLSTRGWLQRTTGNDSLPKAFLGSRCFGGYEDIQALISGGTFEQALSGDLDDSGDEEIERLKQEMTAESVAILLKQGVILTIDEGGSETDVWAEPFASPPVVYYEGEPQPLDTVGALAQKIVARIASGEIEVEWKDED